MGDLYLTLLGPPEVRHADQVLLFSTRKELALLIYLAVEGGVHSRKNLSEQFWPEGDARHGRAALRITLLHLRHMLGEGADVSPVPHLRSRTRPPYPPRSLDLGACVDQHDVDHAGRGASHLACQAPTRDQPPSWRVPGGLLAARCPGLRRLGSVPTRVLAPAHE